MVLRPLNTNSVCIFQSQLRLKAQPFNHRVVWVWPPLSTWIPCSWWQWIALACSLLRSAPRTSSQPLWPFRGFSLHQLESRDCMQLHQWAHRACSRLRSPHSSHNQKQSHQVNIILCRAGWYTPWNNEPVVNLSTSNNFRALFYFDLR